MQAFRKMQQAISFILIVCLTFTFCTFVSASDIAYLMNHDGTNEFTISNKDNTATYQYEVGKDGFAGKLSEDNVYYYSSNDADTGYGYFSVKASIDDNIHDADSEVIEFSFLLKDEKSVIHFSPAFFNETGYDYFLKNGNHTGVTGKGYFKSHNGFIQFSSKGVYVKATDANDYIDPGFRNTYLGKEPLEIGVWHTVAIRLPGLLNSKGEPKYDENNTVVEGAYAGEKTAYVYINGTEYTIPFSQELYGTRHIKMHGRGELYFDDIKAYMTNQLEKPSDYKNAVNVADVKTTYNGIKIKDGVIAYSEELTVSQLKSALTGADAIRVYTDNTYQTLAEDSSLINSKMRVVATAKNGFETERSFSYYSLTEQQSLEIKGISLTDDEGNTVRGYKLNRPITNAAFYLNATVFNNTSTPTKPIKAIVASYNKNGEMVRCQTKEFVVQPGEMQISATENVMKYENITIPIGGTLKAFLMYADTGEPLCDNFATTYGSENEYHILAIGNSYSDNSFSYLPQIAAADGIKIYAVNLYQGGCPISTHHSRMKGNGVYEKRIEYFPDGTKKTTENVSFAEGLATPGYSWDYITLHQKGQYSPFFHRYYTEENPYIVEIANYVRNNTSSGEFLFFENWPVYTDRVIEKYDDVYKPIVEGHEKEEYVPLVFAAIKSCYLQSAEKIGNPGRIIPAGEAVYRAITKYGFKEYELNSSTGNFVSGARAMFADTSSHLTNPYGRVLAGLTWYEYLTGNDARKNLYTTSKIPEADMKLLKEIAHEVCSLPEYQP